MAENQFLGVYATNETPSFMGGSAIDDSNLHPLMKRKRLWFVWALDSGQYRVQPLNAILQPMTAPSIISAGEFEKRFSFEPGCSAAPKEDDAFLSDAKGQTAQIAPQKLTIRADDPDLLRTWLLQNVPPSSPGLEAPSPRPSPSVAQPAGENRRVASEETSSLPRSSGEGEKNAPLPATDAEQALRSGFAMALLKIKQGNREEGFKALEHTLAWDGPPFEGIAELFSEFGLNLRRLGLPELAAASHARALHFSPEDERVHFNLARTYLDLGNLEKSREHLKKALEIAPDFATAKQFLAFLTVPPTPPWLRR